MKHKTNFLRDRKKRTGDEEWSVMEEKGGNRDNTRAQSLLFVCGKSPSLLDTGSWDGLHLIWTVTKTLEEALKCSEENKKRRVF